MSVLPVGIEEGGGYQTQRSLRFRASASASASRTPGSAGNRKLTARRFRIKLGTLGTLRVIASAGTASIDRFYLDSSDRLCLDVLGTSRLVSTPLRRDPTAWYVDVEFQLDVANATAAQRAKILVDGTELAYTSDSRASITNTDTNWNNTVIHYLGRDNAGNYFDGYMAEPIGVDGATASTYTSVDATSGKLVAARPSATWGTTGYSLDFSDATSLTTLMADRSGNGNNWTANNISLTAGATYDSMLDVPLGAGGQERGNYCTLNPLNTTNALNSGNLTTGGGLGGGGYDSFGTVGVSSGKWYWETTQNSLSALALNGIAALVYNAGRIISSGDLYAAYGSDGNKYVTGAAGAAYGATYTTNDVIGTALDCDAGTVTFYKNNVSQGSISITLGHSYGLFFRQSNSGITANFGQRPFAYTPPSGFKPLHTCNLPTPAILNAATAVAHRYEAGSGIAAAIAADRASWSDWIEVFKRVDVAESWKVRFSSDTGNMWAFDSTTAKTAWVAPSAGTCLGIALRVGAAYGLATGTYTGNASASQDVAHSLGNTPVAAIIKNESTGNVYFWHRSMTGAAYFTTISNASPPAQSNANTPFGGSGWNSSTFGVTNNATNNLNASANTYRYILFADIQAFFQALGFTGNASTDGAYLNCGQLPQLQLEKNLAATTDFVVFSDKVDTYNVTASYLRLNTNGVLAAATGVDLVAGGVKHRSSTIANAAAAHCAMSWARAPFKYANAR